MITGPGREVTDIYYDWARIREIGEDGVLLVRPDKHIGWRSMTVTHRSISPRCSLLLGCQLGAGSSCGKRITRPHSSGFMCG